MNESNRRAEFDLARQIDDPSFVRQLWLEHLAQSSSMVRGLRSIRSRLMPRPGAASQSRPAVDVLGSGEEREALARRVVDHYRENLQEVRRLSARYGFEAFFFWQPMLATKAILSAEERDAVRKWGPRNIAFERRVNEVAASAFRKRPYVNDLQNIFDDDPQTVYLDFVHVGEEANRRLAAAMARVIATRLRIHVAAR